MTDPIIFDKICTCGNHMRIAADENGMYSMDKEGAQGISCYIYPDNVVQCIDCRREWRFYWTPERKQAFRVALEEFRKEWFE